MDRVSPNSLLSDFQTRTTAISYTTTPTPVIPASPNRYSFFVWQLSGANIVIGPTSQISPNLGWVISSAVFNYVFSFKDLGPLVCQQWYVCATTPNSTFLTEVIYQPDTGVPECVAKMSESAKMRNPQQAIRRLPQQLRRWLVPAPQDNFSPLGATMPGRSLSSQMQQFRQIAGSRLPPVDSL